MNHLQYDKSILDIAEERTQEINKRYTTIIAQIEEIDFSHGTIYAISPYNGEFEAFWSGFIDSCEKGQHGYFIFDRYKNSYQLVEII